MSTLRVKKTRKRRIAPRFISFKDDADTKLQEERAEQGVKEESQVNTNIRF